jgi:hypothetical protein
MDFVKVQASNAVGPFYLKVTSSSATIISPGNGAVTLDKPAILKLLDFRRSFDYSLAVQERYKQGGSVMATILEYNVENDGELLVIKFTLARTTDTPEIKIERINTETGKFAGEMNLPWEVNDVLFRLFAANQLASARMKIAKIIKVDKLPNETAARDDVVYVFEKELYHLNAAEDELVKLTGTFKQVKKLPQFTAIARTGVLYNLSGLYDDYDLGLRFERGLYTYDAAKNEMELQDLKLVSVSGLPAVAKAKDNVLYKLTKDNADVEAQVKGSVWKLNDGKTAFVQEEREIIDVGRLPIFELAENNVYYIVAGSLVKQANTTTKEYKAFGTIQNVKELPDVSTIQLSDDIVYILTKQQIAANGTARARGTKWVFDTSTKAFVAFEEEDTPEDYVPPEETQKEEGEDEPLEVVKTKVTIPTLKSVEKTGDVWTATFNNFDTSKMTATGTTANAAGNHTATFTLKDTTNTEWADSTSAPKEVAWAAEE